MESINLRKDESELLNSLYDLLYEIKRVVKLESSNSIFNTNNIMINKEGKEIRLSNVSNLSLWSGTITEYTKNITYKLSGIIGDEEVSIDIKLGLDFSRTLEIGNKSEYAIKMRDLMNLILYNYFETSKNEISKCQEVVNFYLKR